MAVKIRLARDGAKKKPYYHIVVADARAPRDGKFIRKVGTHNPLVEKTDADWVKLNIEAVKHWLSVGAKPTERVNKFFTHLGITI
jgi:small subunit ribosomal protein S16